MKKINFYTKEHCTLCHHALDRLKILQGMYDFSIQICDIETEEQWFEKYHLVIPVVELVNGKKLLGNEVSFEEIEHFLQKNL